MDFTRNPIVESVITPKEGCKLVVRSSKAVGQEEFFVDSVEVVSFGQSIFLRSLEKPKSFLVPANDYEILEVRETRMVLKHVGVDRSIKIASKEGAKPKESEETPPQTNLKEPQSRPEKKRERRGKHFRHRKERQQISEGGPQPSEEPMMSEGEAPVPPPFSSILPPPSKLISESLKEYQGSLFKEVFPAKEEEPEPFLSEPEPRFTEELPPE